MICRKCSRDIPDDAVFCCYCGIRIQKNATRRKRANGEGTVYSRGKTWTAKILLDYAPSDGSYITKNLYKGGFPTRSKALEFIPVLKAAVRIPEEYRRQVLAEASALPTTAESITYITQWQRTQTAEQISFHALYDKWFDFYEPRIDKSTMNGHRAALAYYKDLWALPFPELTADDLQECIDNCPRGRRTQENMRQLAKRLYEYAIGRLIVSVNCASYLYIPKGGSSPRAALTQSHIDAIGDLVGVYPFADYVYCLAYLGFRPNEMLRLTKDAYHIDDGVHYLIGGFKTPAGTDRVVTISPRIQPIIERLAAAPGDYLFPGLDGGCMDDAYFRNNVFYPLLAKLGIQPIPATGERAQYVPYSCRHFFSNLLKDASGADKDKAALIGHSDYSTTVRVYQSADLANMQRITDAF